MAFQITDSQRGSPSLFCGGFSFFLYFKIANKTTWRCSKKTCSARVIMGIANATVLKIEFDHNHDGFSEQQEARQIFAGRCRRRAAENLSGCPSKIIKQELASTLNSSAALNYQDLHCLYQQFYQQKKKALPALPKNRSQVSNDKYDKFQLDVLYLYISRCMISLLK